MNLKELEAVIAASRSKSFYEAACALNYAPSVISKYVSGVEDELGVVLFARGNRASDLSLTQEGALLLPHLIRMYESYQALRHDAAALTAAGGGPLRIGTGVSLYSPGMDEIMADFIRRHPEVGIEQTKLDLGAQLHALYAGDLDGVFCLVQDGSQSAERLGAALDDPRIESYLLVRDGGMYLGISANDPLAAQDVAPLAAFRDFSIVFHSNQEMRLKAGTMAPFVELSKKSGFDLKPIYLDPRDTSAYYLAAQMKIAVPSLRCSLNYHGIKFVRVADWEASSSSYFLSLKASRSAALALFKKSVQVFLKGNSDTKTGG